MVNSFHFAEGRHWHDIGQSRDYSAEFLLAEIIVKYRILLQFLCPGPNGLSGVSITVLSTESIMLYMKKSGFHMLNRLLTTFNHEGFNQTDSYLFSSCAISFLFTE